MGHSYDNKEKMNYHSSLSPFNERFIQKHFMWKFCVHGIREDTLLKRVCLFVEFKINTNTHRQHTISLGGILSICTFVSVFSTPNLHNLHVSAQICLIKQLES